MGVIKLNNQILKSTTEFNIIQVPSPYIKIISSVTPYNALISGSTIDNGYTITERGFVYGTTNPPTKSNNYKTVTGTTGNYSKNITGLTSGSTYYVRAYAINSQGIGYSAVESFITNRVTQFNYVGNWTYYTPVGCTKLEFLVIGGGGGGGANAGSAGGAGGYRCSVAGETNGGGMALDAPFTGVSITTTISVTVGAGGTPSVHGYGVGFDNLATNGGNSVFETITALGGGCGKNGGNDNAANAGGCGGGATRYSTIGTISGGTGTYGYRGGNATITSGSQFCSGGGGGAGGAGQDMSNGGRTGGNGGAGLTSSITGTAVTRASGGSSDSNTTVISGGGGAMAVLPIPNTGGGGALFSGGVFSGQIGATGVVIIRAYFN